MIRENRAPPEFHLDAFYYTRYPDMVRMMDDHGINSIWRNVFYHCWPVITRSADLFDMLENGVFADADPGFINAAAGDFRLAPDAALFKTVSFNPILFQRAKRLLEEHHDWFELPVTSSNEKMQAL